MRLYSDELKKKIRELRAEGRTYPEIQIALGAKIPKGSLTYICTGVEISSSGSIRLKNIKTASTSLNREKAVRANKVKFDTNLENIRNRNLHLFESVQNRDSQLIALAMLYLGEGAKWHRSRGLKLASADPKIIRLYIDLLRLCFEIPTNSLRCRIQHRADQNPDELLKFWSDTTNIKPDRFNRPYVDKRTLGKRTERAGYMGVCTVMCPGTHIQLELEEIAGIISKAMRGISAVG